MAFNHQTYNNRYLLNARDSGEALNDASDYDIRIVEADDVAEGETYWKVIGVHHLLPRENFSNHHVYLEALDENGQRATPPAWVGWTWEGRRPDEPANPAPLDKPANESGNNIAVFFGQTISVWIQGQARGGTDKSDRVENIHTAHPDEPTSDGALLNTLGHHSFYVVFQRTKKESKVTGTINGRLERGQGRHVRLLRGTEVVGEATVDASLSFSFENIPLGLYKLDVVGEDVDQDNIRVDPNNPTVTINIAVPVPDDSIIEGRVDNAVGQTLLLLRGRNIIARVQLPRSGGYRFTQLGAGSYALRLLESNIIKQNITVDGTNTQRVDINVPTVQPGQDNTGEEEVGQFIDHYVLFGPPDSRGRQTNLLLAIDYLLHFSATAGFSMEEAKKARQITIIGEGISPFEQQELRQAGSRVEVLAGDSYDIEAELARRISAGRAFGG